MRTLTALFLAAVLTSTAHAGEDCKFLNGYDMNEEDLSIALSVRPVPAARPGQLLAMQRPASETRAKDAVRVCAVNVHASDPQRSVEAGWEPVIKQVNCETGEVLTRTPQQPNNVVTG